MTLGVPLQQCGAALLTQVILSLIVVNSRVTWGARNWMRPVPSHDLPVLDLIEPKDKRYDPKPEDLSPKPLRERLDRDFDKQFMSETRPLESILHPNGTVEFSFKRTKRGKLVPSSKMPKEIRHLRLHALKLPDGSRFRMKVGKKMRRKFKQMLWAYTYCPVAYRWKDLGLRFWPRWIKEGSCLTLGSCSFPSATYVIFLLWFGEFLTQKRRWLCILRIPKTFVLQADVFELVIRNLISTASTSTESSPPLFSSHSRTISCGILKQQHSCSKFATGFKGQLEDLITT
ncbi:Noggin-2 like protein [Argiope bruennichi]|uniref:Noggin-2 like protein n=1 Tax=Argiope bruennichi TaxID=94029 RepID=A0A8T0ENA1_ARGBR|nr:Noggin-2 like protein [Argiope bruennichi]